METIEFGFKEGYFKWYRENVSRVDDKRFLEETDKQFKKRQKKIKKLTIKTYNIGDKESIKEKYLLYDVLLNNKAWDILKVLLKSDKKDCIDFFGWYFSWTLKESIDTKLENHHKYQFTYLLKETIYRHLSLDDTDMLFSKFLTTAEKIENKTLFNIILEIKHYIYHQSTDLYWSNLYKDIMFFIKYNNYEAAEKCLKINKAKSVKMLRQIVEKRDYYKYDMEYTIKIFTTLFIALKLTKEQREYIICDDDKLSPVLQDLKEFD